ncbi:UNVERIFIED_ORG: hypothetical protein ABID33_000083 [Xanthobacter viscosus]|uniref:Uncharacterized protein n=1 Tax=Xanthobacter autotrophicus TaxID=280 RepID=A0A6C1KTU0_XANAU|nr:hypothetical protein [Xanthobacter autotrophicus]TLX44006.1 hypothetical protein FBQ73_07940 [Xanthobacter autotrophicus]
MPAPRITAGVLTDPSSVFTDHMGQGPALASAIEWNEADRGGALVRRWIDENNVGVIADMPTMAIRPRRAVELITTGAA